MLCSPPGCDTVNAGKSGGDAQKNELVRSKADMASFGNRQNLSFRAVSA